MKRLWILAGAALAVAGIANAQDEQDEETARANKIVCKTEKITGSRTKVRRVCMSRRDWDELALNTRRGVNMLEDDANQKESICLRNGTQSC